MAEMAEQSSRSHALLGDVVAAEPSSHPSPRGRQGFGEFTYPGMPIWPAIRLQEAPAQ